MVQLEVCAALARSDPSGCNPPDWRERSRLRDELLNGETFYTLREAQIIIESWRRHYNTIRPHASLGCKLPAPGGLRARFYSVAGFAGHAGATASAKTNFCANRDSEITLWLVDRERRACSTGDKKPVS